MIKIFEKFNEPEKREEYYDNGQKLYEVWYLNGKWHRENGPAIQHWYEDGQKRNESWYLNNERHREDGPARQIWNENGQKMSESWYLNNKYFTRKDWVEELKKIGSPHYEEQIMLLDMEKYNL